MRVENNHQALVIVADYIYDKRWHKFSPERWGSKKEWIKYRSQCRYIAKYLARELTERSDEPPLNVLEELIDMVERFGNQEPEGAIRDFYLQAYDVLIGLEYFFC